MITIHLELLDFMDNTPAEGIGAEITLNVHTRVYTRLDLPDGAGPKPNKPTKPILLPEHTIPLVQTGRSNSAGVVEVTFDAREAFRQATALLSNRAGDVVAIPAVKITRPDLPKNIWFGYESAESGSHILSQNASFRTVLFLDLAKAIVGEVTDRSARLWFQLHTELHNYYRFTCVVEGRTLAQPLSFPLSFRQDYGGGFRTDLAKTANLFLQNLEPASTYRYTLYLTEEPVVVARAALDPPTALNSRLPLCTGAFHTEDPQADRWSFAFGSCHYPSEQVNENDPYQQGVSLNRWSTLARRDDYDFFLLIGDQIYGDEIEDLDVLRNKTWFERYAFRYNQFWQHYPIRRVLGKTPTYMIFDDHDVDDDWGIDHTGEGSDGRPITPEQEAAGLMAYRVFQQAHNPGGDNGGQFDYSITKGPAAFYFMDGRSPVRGSQRDFPKFGRNQWNRIRRWARSEAVLASDLIFFVTPVPVAFLPVEEVRRLIREIEDSATSTGAAGGGLLGAVVGGIVGGLTGNPGLGILAGYAAGAIAGGIAGHELAEGKIEEKGLGNLTQKDLADMWTVYEPDKGWDHQKDLVHLLDLLYNLANDIRENGSRGNRKRAVFLLGGDVHSGSMHLIRANQEQRPQYQANPLIFQVTSSAISHSPASDQIYEKVVRHIRPGHHISEADLIGAGFDFGTLANNEFGKQNAIFPLDDKLGSNYWAEFIDMISERNFGRVVYEKKAGAGRTYQIHLYVEGESRVIRQAFELNLDAAVITPVDLYNQVAAATGKITLLRVHDVGSAYGPPQDRIDAEVIVQLDSEPGRAFGFQLREDGRESAHQKMFDLLRDAFNLDRRVRLEYLTTGDLNGQLIRVIPLQ